MVLSDTDITVFQELYRKELGIEISREEAYEKGIKLLTLMSAIYKPMTKENFEFIQKHRNDTVSLLIKKLQ